MADRDLAAGASLDDARGRRRAAARRIDLGRHDAGGIVHRGTVARLGGWLLGILVAVTAVASDFVPAQRPAAPVVLVGGTVHTVSGAVLEKTDVLLTDGRIAALGSRLARPANAQVIDVAGRHVYPGLIAADTTLGLNEVEAVRATVDAAEVGGLNPNARALVAVNPDSELIPVARSNGVLTAHVAPAAGRAGLLAGTSALIRLDGWTWEDLALRPAVGLHVYWPAMAVARNNPAAPPVAEQEKAIAERINALRTAFAAARAYAKAKAAGPADTDLRWEAMVPVVRGERLLFVHAETLRQITAALDWAREEGLKIVLVGGADAGRVADRLREEDVPVIVGGTLELPARRDAAYDEVYATAAKLHAAGVRFCLAGSAGTAAGSTNLRNLPYEAGMAAAYGLPADEALKAVTLYPAQILGVAAELGSIEPGKRATLMVTDGDPLEITTQVQLAFIDGAPVDLRSRHTQLYEKYRQRPVK